MNLQDFLTRSASPALQAVLAASHARARADGKRTSLAMLLDQILEEDSVRSRLPEEVRNRARAGLSEQIRATPTESQGAGGLAFDLQALAGPATESMRAYESAFVTPLLFLATALSSTIAVDPESERARQCLRTAGVTAEMFLPATTDQAKRQDFTFRASGLDTDGLGTDLTAMARAGRWASCPLVGMDDELDSLVAVLNSMRYSAAIVGEPGVGKSAFLNGFAWHIVNRTRPLISQDMDSWTVVRIEAADMLKGTSGRGELERRVKDVLAFFMRNPTIIPFFEEVHKLLDTDDPSSRTVATLLKVPMADERFRCVGVTTDHEYSRFIASDDAMNSRFRKILLPEPTQEVACGILRGVLPNLLSRKAVELGVHVADDAIPAAVKVTSAYQKANRLPRKAINLLSETAEYRALRLSRSDASTSGLSTRVTGGDVARYFTKVTGIPVDDLDGDRASYARRLETGIKAKIKGQDEAIDSITTQLSLYASGYTDRRRPRGRFLFVGPPGVGKTELALALADEVMRNRGSLVTLDMAQYTKEDALNKFMGASPGYVGFGETPTVYSKVMMRPFSVVVLDEFEKASPVLANPLLSILDGHGEDSKSRAIDFSQCIFVLTSNAITEREVLLGVALEKLQTAGAAHTTVLEALGFPGHTEVTAEAVAGAIGRLDDERVSRELSRLAGGDEEIIRRFLIALGGIWTPPLVDRIDRVALFRPLTRAALADILDRMIENRRSTASQPLPSTLDSPSARQEIIEWATAGEATPSARRLERALLRWLTTEVLGGAASVSNDVRTVVT